MLRVAVTGNIGSGKSTVCRVFEILSVPVFYADTEAKKLYDDENLLHTLTNKFGEKILRIDKRLDFKAFADIIFNNPAHLSYVNQLIHPLVFKKYLDWSNAQREKPYCIMETALTFETGNYKKMDRTILVYAPENELIERVTRRDKATPFQVKERLSRQWLQEEKRQLADFCITNDNSTLIIPQILNLHNILSQNGVN